MLGKGGHVGNVVTKEVADVQRSLEASDISIYKEGGPMLVTASIPFEFGFSH